MGECLFVSTTLFNLTKRLAHPDHLTRLDQKLEVLGGLKDQHNSRAKLEPTHLLANVQGLAVQQAADATVNYFTISTLVAVLTAVSAELLYINKKCEKK